MAWPSVNTFVFVCTLTAICIGQSLGCQVGRYGSSCELSCDSRCRNLTCRRDTGSCELNVALHQSAEISSQDPSSGPAGNAVNGDTSSNLNFTANNCFLTNSKDTTPWFQVDLGRSYPVYRMTMSYRFAFQRSVVPSTITVDGNECYRLTSFVRTRTPTFFCENTTYGQVVRIDRVSRDNQSDFIQLTLCELQIWVCTSGFYRDTCDTPCIVQQCAYCDQQTGSECYECNLGWYGHDCSEQCLSTKCKDNLCDISTGHCTGCEGVLSGDLCTDCPSGTYGEDCSESCGKCSSAETSCNSENGHCLECESGWELPLCTDCDDGFYGDECTSQCGQCAADSTCDTVTGQCPLGCQAGWTGPQCDQNCPSGTYGEDCSESCGKCSSAETSCNSENGHCLECESGWKLPLCKDCNAGFYGDECASQCGQCTSGSTCDTVTGQCPLGCQAGWTGPQCNQTCSGRTYGSDCTSQCGHCAEKSQCNTVTGRCPHECDAGWTGIRCDQKAESRDNKTTVTDASSLVGPLAGAIVGGFALLGLIIIVPIIICLRRKRNRQSLSVDRVELHPVSQLRPKDNPPKGKPEGPLSPPDEGSNYERVSEAGNPYDSLVVGNPYDSLQPLDQRPDERSMYAIPVFKNTFRPSAQSVYYDNTIQTNN